ncbi:MAG: hypothetical protein H6741_11665 [Alphaproteobacteria bacterium]|nr:hypothetical protein [Alphaproteobacteria bacterium]
MIALLLLLSGPARADLVPPSPPPEGAVAEDLPPPPLPGGALPLGLAVAGGVTLLLGVFVLLGARGRGPR